MANAMLRHAFVTVTDRHFLPGTLATVSSILEFHPQTSVYVVNNARCPLTPPQAECLGHDPRIRLMDSSAFSHSGRHVDAWELKAYAMCDLAERAEVDVLVGIDSDCLLCADVDRELRTCAETGGFLGGKDGDGAEYDDSYQPYGIEAPARNDRYMSTSLVFCAVTDANKAVLRRWAECCAAAVFNGCGPYPGHGDQGVLNAVLFAAGRSDAVHLLDNLLWSQHWCYWQSQIDWREGAFLNRSAGHARQRAFHCGGSDKFWAIEHRERVFDAYPGQTYPYAWFLAMLWFGRCRNWAVDPFQYLPPAAHHLADDLAHAFPIIMQVYPPARQRWDAVSDRLIDRVLNGIPRAMSLAGGSMTEAIQLVSAWPHVRRYVEIGSYEGGSVLTLGLRFANRDIQFYSVESFAGNHDGTMDGHRLPSRAAYLANLARFASLRVQYVPGDSVSAARVFADGSVDMIFIDACHDTDAVLRDIDAWADKLAPGAIVAGDDYGWPSVAEAVTQRFSDVSVSPSGCVWWARARR
jgi:predicted O-methyltransferase YrrM